MKLLTEKFLRERILSNGNICIFISILFLISIFPSCKAVSTAMPRETAISVEEASPTVSGNITVTDSVGREVVVPRIPKRAVALTSSLSDLWVLSGGSLTATSDDTFRERPELTESIPGLVHAGGLLEPNAESILSVDPQFVVLSDSLAAHRKLAELLDEKGIPYYYAKSDTFKDYLAALKNFSAIMGREDIYVEFGEKQEAEIDDLIKRVPNGVHPTVLFIRVSTSKVEALSKDHIVCSIIDDSGAENIAFTEEIVLKDLSLEAVIKADPDFIFAVMQGTDTKASERILEEKFTSNPLWSELSAVKGGHFIVLPKELYQLKPNARWKDAYEGLFEILYPETF
jgi:iron complex transport system substrate-binding protein